MINSENDERRSLGMYAIGKGIAIMGIWGSCAVATAFGAPAEIFLAAAIATVFIGLLF